MQKFHYKMRIRRPSSYFKLTGDAALPRVDGLRFTVDVAWSVEVSDPTSSRRVEAATFPHSMSSKTLSACLIHTCSRFSNEYDPLYLRTSIVTINRNTLSSRVCKYRPFRTFYSYSRTASVTSFEKQQAPFHLSIPTEPMRY